VNVLALTIFVSVILAGMFTLLWLVAVCSPQAFSDREALLPLEDDAPVEPSPIETKPHDH
jgi:hypothetical protein